MTPRMLKTFIRAFEIRTEREMKILNYHGWLSGVYTMNALGSLLSQSTNYPEAPFEMQRGVDPDERSQIEAELFRAYVEEYNNQLKRQT